MYHCLTDPAGMGIFGYCSVFSHLHKNFAQICRTPFFIREFLLHCQPQIPGCHPEWIFPAEALSCRAARERITCKTFSFTSIIFASCGGSGSGIQCVTTLLIRPYSLVWGWFAVIVSVFKTLHENHQCLFPLIAHKAVISWYNADLT